MGSLTGKVIVITGGYGVLCGSMAKTLVNEGARVAILGRSLEKAEAFVKSLGNEGEALGLAADVLDKNSLEKAYTKIKNHWGPCDILINGAGGNHPEGITDRPFMQSGDESDQEIKSFFDLDATGFKYVLDLNLLGTLLPSQVFAKDMVGRQNCSIINIASVASFKPLTKVSAYSSAKAAIVNFTQWLAVHFAKTGIRVNAIAPGFFLADQNRALLTNADGSLTERGQQIINQTPIGRFGEPEDLSSTLLWLLDSRSSFVTGAIIPVDGGFTAYAGV
ncbi:SDR family oxidoreductase [Belliella pelovolcani]|uniref:NAD(P)-dependent dehydrogenase, short-chain alcohol dehydrogenase family n=1 Tax=Belliella pelovolcani TaxID=529505 RepID=A0A1N7P155_9BACT|nr:SDR family oxidoreductase [Belliella pelovolcani]SIT04303.1 NAD(P)-dependent dehydrogenase, short-chain alcohol dehydrogenase family [Belliella pelovolcani]